MENSENIWNDENLIEVLRKNGVVVMPTDTLYGIVGQALNSSVVERIYFLRKRNPEKPCIILIGTIDELEKFSVILSEEQKEFFARTVLAKDAKDGPVSIVLDCPDKKFLYLHRATKTLAFRIPFSQPLRDLLLKTGPLIAPSANLEALPPSETISEAKKYFGNLIDLYVDGGKLTGKASKVIRLRKDGTISIIRE